MAFDDGVKTVSGSIAHTDDAATKVPFVSVKCGIEPTLSGVSSVSETQTGRNLFDLVPYLATAYNTPSFSDCMFVKGGSYTFSFDKISDGTTDATSWRYCVTVYDTEGQLVTDWTISASLPYRAALYSYVNGANSSNKYITFNLQDDCYIFIRFWSGNTTADMNMISPMLELGNTASAFEPYSGTTYTASLGRTIYGGTANIVNGVGTNENNKFTVTSDMSDSIRYIGSGDTAYIQINKTPASNGRWQDLVCSHFTPANIYAGGTQQGIGCYSSQFYIRDSRFTSKQDFLDFLTEQETLGKPLEICYKLATPTDFTFTPITPTPETVGKVNNVYCNTGNTEVTYYDNAHGFSEVTVNKTGKNLWSSDKDLSITRDKTMYMRIPRGTYTLSFDFVSSTASPVPSYMQVAYSTTDGTKYNPVTVVEGRCSRTFTLSADARALTIYSSTSYSASVGVTTVVNNIQLEVGSQASSYEPYEAVSKTAYLHKVIYGGQADVVKGTCEPKNLFDDSTFPRTATENNTYYASFQSILAEGNKYKIPTIHIEPDVAYVLSFDVECNTEPFNASVGIGTGYYSKDIASVNNNTSGRISVPFTLTSALKEQYGDILSFRVPRYSSTREFTFTISNVQLEKASSASEYVPHFEPFSFPPISMSTDEGENTLFANEGDSAITYRKAVD